VCLQAGRQHVATSYTADHDAGVYGRASGVSLHG
jgi:hypothetical protein